MSNRVCERPAGLDQISRARYGHAMAGFVAWLRDHWDALKAVALTAAEAMHWRGTGWHVMLHLAEKQTEIVAQENTARKYSTILREQIAQGKLYCKRRELLEKWWNR